MLGMMHPMSPQTVAQTSAYPQAPAAPMRGAMSEQLLPRSPEAAERIPHLPQIPVAQFQERNQQQSQPATPSAAAVGAPVKADEEIPLLTRVSELELVNDLLKRRVQDLENAEAQARKEADSLKRKLEEITASPTVHSPVQPAVPPAVQPASQPNSPSEPESKRIRVSELV